MMQEQYIFDIDVQCFCDSFVAINTNTVQFVRLFDNNLENSIYFTLKLPCPENFPANAKEKNKKISR